MLIPLCLAGILLSSYAMVVAKRIPALVDSFRWQSFFLFLTTLAYAFREGEIRVFVVAALLFLMKVCLIPQFLTKLVKKIKVEEHLGLFLNPLLSLVAALVLTYASWVFSSKVLAVPRVSYAPFVVSMTVTLIGFFIMVFRLKALTQIVGLLVMENGIFLLAASMAGGMPFFVELAVAFDVFVCVVITGIFMYRINKLFTHIEVNQLTDLRG